MSYNIVVGHYNEDLNWLSSFDKDSIIVYSKGESTSIECIQKFLPNVGRESHTYLYYIIENYENLPDVIFFTQGNIKDHTYPVQSGSYYSTDKTYIEDNFLNINTISSLNILRSIFKFGISNDYHVASNSIEDKCIYSGREFFSKFINNSINLEESYIYIYYNGIFSVKREAILSRSKEYYEELIKLLTHSSSPEVGHFFERSWFYIFNLDKYL